MAHIPADKAPGYDCVFVKKPEEIQTDCPICLLILRQPVQMLCCGNVYCRACINKELCHRNFCPTCKEPNPTLFPDKRIKQSLSGFRVYCIHSAKEGEGGRQGEGGGCEWVGELGDLERHLNRSPSKDTQMNGCLYTEIKCMFCTSSFKRSTIGNHQSKRCPKRPCSCPHCQYSSTYVEITEKHRDICPCFPVRCPHCKDVFERQHLKRHINQECALAPVVCDFNLAGCQEQLSKTQMKDHINNNGVYHAHLFAEFAKQHGNERLEPYLPMLTSSVDTLTAQNKALSEKISSLQNVQLVLFLAVGFLILILVALCQRLYIA